jgi:hypothetical protein
MSQHLTISPGEVADCLAIRELIEANAHCADRRDANRQMSLFTADTRSSLSFTTSDRTPGSAPRPRRCINCTLLGS